MIHKLFCSLLFLSLLYHASGQERATGLIFDSASVRAVPYKAQLITADYRNLPSSVSLEQYCPVAGDQGRYGTCVAFATAYHLRTILYTKLMREANYTVNPNANIFSPSFVYEQIKLSEDVNCQLGARPTDAFELLKYTGVARLQTQPYACGSPVRKEAMLEGPAFKISAYQTLYSIYETDADVKVNATRKALAEGYPCMLSFLVTKSFYNVKGDVWRALSTDDGPTGKHGRHAMCIVGYDDNKYGGAFRVLNSWGTGWADKGFVWIPYKDFAKYSLTVIQAYAAKPEPKPQPKPEVKPDPKPQPKPEPKPEPVVDPSLKGSLYFQKNTGEDMGTRFINSLNTASYEDFGYYEMKETHASGTRFRFYMKTNTEAYMYAFATDLTAKINQIFPFNDGVSPLVGKNSTFAFPAENKVIRMDDNAGKDYLLILYSKKPLNVPELMAKMNSNYGNLLERAGKALGNDITRRSDIKYTENKIEFNLQQSSSGSVVPVLVEISHK
jgi:hypothetical protein